VDGRTAQADQTKAIAFATALRRRPGKWARVTHREFGTADRAGAYALAIRQARVNAFKPYGAFEAISRLTEVYARYIGENGEHR